ncbi:aldo/keto reductase [Polyangium aurulentum]|uniref:aldo/keto reductase n=1 Tax=Polyangium aurulentum TaxID=2567896 RepID=UPI0010ADAC5B|nr:aldo/keto reductase [Polyangium aurulentum]
MGTRSSRRTFISSIGASLALAACAKNQQDPESIVDAKEPPPKGPLPGAPKAEDVDLPAGAEMPMRTLGRTGVKVSLVGLGGFHIGMQKDEKESIDLIRFALDHGINFLDNCWDYNDGDSEKRMGKALADGYREKAFLMTKIDGRTRKPAAEQLEQSLERLRTDVIDLVQIHEIIRSSDPAACFGPDGAIEALVAAQKAGKIKYIGFTGHKDPAIHLAMLKAAEAHNFRFDAVQMPLNVMDHHYRSFEKEVLPVLTQQGIGVLGMKSLGSGAILQSGAVTAVECLHYAMNLPVSTVITGCDSMGVLKQAIKAAQTFRPLEPAQVQALLDRTAPHGKTGKLEQFKTTERFDGTEKNPKWLTTSEI